MKKLFLAIYFSLCTFPVFAGLRQVSDYASVAAIPQQPQQEKNPVYDITPNDLSDFLEQRLKRAVIMDADKLTQDNISFEASDSAKQQMKAQNKTIFEKIYDNVMQRANNNNTPAGQTPQWEMQQQQQIGQMQSSVKQINIALPPYNQMATVAAVEHIPYLYDRIELLPDGTAFINEKLVILSENKKEDKGLIKKLPRYVYGRNGRQSEIRYTLAEVKINGQPVAYKISEKEKQIWLEPDNSLNLEAGIYQYEFSFTAGGLLTPFDKYLEFYWNVSGGGWDYVVAKMGATISLPAKSNISLAFALSGYGRYLQNSTILPRIEKPNVFSFSVTEPLFIRENMHISVILEDNGAVTIPFGQKMSGFIDNNTGTLLSALAFAFIFFSYLLSWRGIKKSKTKTIATLKKTPEMLRFTQHGFDAKNLAIYFLNWFRKNIIDIQNAGETVLLIKKTDQLKSLSKSEKKALLALFGNHDAVFKANSMNLLQIKRAAKYLRRGLQKALGAYMLKINSSYLFFSCSMLFLTEAAIVYLKTPGWGNFILLALLTVMEIFAAVLFWFSPRKKIANIILKILSAAAGLLLWIMSCAILLMPAAALILASAWCIGFYTVKFFRSGSLFGNSARETEKQKEYLLKHKENILMGKEFANQQPMIFALDLEGEFKTPEALAEFNKFEAMNQLIKTLGRKN